ncbi:MAG: molybdopterin molybdenumtransferase MoeA [Betaproteobacteria bacterium]|nr:molybdopterin molybdenumtransferase MoeA [Betaproteobacteria bacterium]
MSAPGDSLQDAISCISDYDPNALPVADANRVIRSLARPLQGIETLAIREALGRVLAADLISPIDVPGHDNSAMDGWAFRAADLNAGAETLLTEIGSAFAGGAFTGNVGNNQCVRIMTGAVMPQGTDTVLPQESARIDGKRIHIPAGQQRGQHRRLAGEDLAKGKPALCAGTLLRPAELGLAASLGIAQVQVRRRPRVAFFSTGNELRSVGQPLAEGEIYDSNRYTLWGMLTRLGCEVIDMGVVRDEPALIEAAFREAANRADAVITTGGVSVGAADYTKSMMARLGEVVFWTLAMRPGRPMAFGRVSDGEKTALLFGLPGNPVAVMVTFYFFVRGALLAMAGRRELDPPMLRAQAAAPMKKKPGRTEYLRGILANIDGDWRVRLTGPQGSGILNSMAMANCFVVLRHEQGNVAAGERVDVLLMEGLV